MKKPTSLGTWRESVYILVMACTVSFSLLSSFPASAQLKVNFKADTTQGCPPVIVSFTDLSAGNPVSWEWDFGNGNKSSLQNPQAVYDQPGNYEVTLTVSDGLTEDKIIKQSYITISDTPRVNFLNSPASGCYPLQVNFKDGSTAGSGNIKSWLWDFGDGTLSHQPNPSHAYKDVGKFNITLSVTNSAGCTSGTTKKSAVITNEGIKADFSTEKTLSCAAPMAVRFKAQSSSKQDVTYLWNFGDGSSGTGANPQHTFTKNGVYTVTLRATILNGCTDTIVKENYIHVGTFKTSFVLPQGCAKVPLTFKNTSTPLPDSAIWYFTDGAVINKINATHKFSNSGTYTVKLVNIYGSCRDTLSKSITTYPMPKADFKTGQQAFCGLPASVSFQDISQDATSWLWDFGDGETSSKQHPLHTYKRGGNFDITLQVKNKTGCVDTLTKANYIHLSAPKAHFKATSISGCIPLEVTFQNEVESDKPVTDYHWDFGDGTTSTAANPAHTYTGQGVYNVSLTIVTASGCKDSLVRKAYIHAGTKPNVNFEATPSSACLQTRVQFNNLSKPAGDVWEWVFPQDGNATESDENPLHQFHNLGKQDVTLIVNNNGCADTLSKIDYINIEPPKAAMEVKRNCSDRYTLTFSDKSQKAESWLWDFGDGTSSDQQNPSAHQYKETGKYVVILTAKNKSCTSTTRQTIHVIDEQPALQVRTDTICHDTGITLSAGNLTDASLIKSYSWITGDGRTLSSKDPEMKVVYKKSGHYGARLVTTDINGCKDSSQIDSILVRGPKSAFTVSSSTACPGIQVSFTDKSTSSGSAIQQWVWDYGDGTSETLSGNSVIHKYKEAGKYKVTLTVTDQKGCTDKVALTNAVSVYAAKADFSVSDTLFCPGTPLNWANTSKGTGLNYLWRFGDNTTSTDRYPSKTYTSEGIFSVSLQIETKDGCKDSVVRENYIRAGKPHVKMKYADNGASCPPFVVSVTNQATNYSKIVWDFGDGTTSTKEDTARHVYNIPGNYKLRMRVYGYSNGCVDSIVKSIHVAGPYGKGRVMDSTGCSPHTVRFAANAVNAVSYRWDFGDGSLSPGSPDDAVNHVYKKSGLFVPKLILTDSRHCTVAIPIKDKITIDKIEAQPLISRPEICDSGQIQFDSKEKIFSVDQLGKSASYTWNFGDLSSANNVSNKKRPVHHYQQPGDYSAALQIKTDLGCNSHDTVLVNVPVPQTIQVSTTTDTAVCEGEPVPLQASGGYHYTWSPHAGLNDPNSSDPIAKPESTTTYQVVAYSKEKCLSDTTQVKVTIHEKPHIKLFSDTTVATGSIVRLQTSASSNVTEWSWTPPDYLSCVHCASPVSTPRSPITYRVVASNQFGCISTDEVKINLVCAKGKVFIPNSFTPNNDGMNDIFYPRGRGVREVLYFRIYNRWGQLVYERTHFQINDKSAGWDGSFKGNLYNPGVFIYQTAMVCDDGKVFQIKGDITLIR